MKEEEEKSSQTAKALSFFESRWQTALATGLLTAFIVFFSAPPMILDEEGKPSVSKALFWGAVAAALVMLLPMGVAALAGEATATAVSSAAVVAAA